MDVQCLSENPSCHMNLSHQLHRALKFIIPRDLTVTAALPCIACHATAIPLHVLFDEMEDCSIHIRVPSFLRPCEALGGWLTRKYGSMVIPPRTNLYFTYCKFTSCSSTPVLCCMYVYGIWLFVSMPCHSGTVCKTL
jgi:hypothetical protein